jgi:hypothetical protein
MVYCFGACSTRQPTELNTIKLRYHSKIVPISEAKKIIKQKNFFDKFWNQKGCFENEFELRKTNGIKLIYDYSTSLIWHQSGSKDFLNLEDAKKWIAELNTCEYAGINTWRLPTLEEALSLLENQKMNNNLYIDQIFDRWQWCILTGDSLDATKSWLVAFSGRVDWFDSAVRINYVRPVSSM